MKNPWVTAWIAYSLAWVATAIAVSVGIYITNSGWCLWALILPATISFKTEGSKEAEK